MSERKGDWQQTFTGREFWPLDPRPEEVSIRDIAHALSLVCRFQGHCRYFYSVAQHSLFVAAILKSQDQPVSVQLAGLLHDAAEAYICDVVRPLKRLLGSAYKDTENLVAAAIGQRYGIELVTLPDVEKMADEIALATEMQHMMKVTRDWGLSAKPLEVFSEGMKLDERNRLDVEDEFLLTFHELSESRMWGRGVHHKHEDVR